MSDPDTEGMTLTGGGLIAAIVPDSPAQIAGVQPGDRLLSVGGHHLRDIIDYRYYLDPGAQEIELSRNGQQLRVIKVIMDAGPGIDPGIEFSGAIFDHIRSCRCRCLFCFVDQLPRGLRKSLYLKDDDFRLSFLYGNFITLNNLQAADIARIKNQHLSPLYVSVHATDPVARGRLMGVSEELAARGLATLKSLGDAGIVLHAQTVLCPGINDRQVLNDTVTTLATQYAGIASIGIVPVAVSPEHLMHHAGISEPGNGEPLPLRPVTADDCREVIAQGRAWQKRFRQEGRSGFVYAADEFYLRAGMPLPPMEEYDDFAQYENGVGIAASFVEEAASRLHQALEGMGDIQPRRLFLLSGTLAAGLMGKVCRGLTDEFGFAILPLVAENRLFGPYVTVTGLLGGRDIIRAAESAGLGRGDLLLIPAACLSTSENPCFLDDLTLEKLDEALNCIVAVT